MAGVPIAFAAESDKVASNIDHFWITVGMGHAESFRIALSTHSRQNAAAGFDPRVRVGVVASAWKELPAPGVLTCRGLDYREIEAAGTVTYIEYERPALETLLAEKTGRALFIEAWGEFYFRNHLGIHQGAQPTRELQRIERLHRTRRCHSLLFWRRCDRRNVALQILRATLIRLQTRETRLQPQSTREGTRTPKDCSTRS